MDGTTRDRLHAIARAVGTRSHARAFPIASRMTIFGGWPGPLSHLRIPRTSDPPTLRLRPIRLPAP